MSIETVVSEIDAEIARLEQARALLSRIVGDADQEVQETFNDPTGTSSNPVTLWLSPMQYATLFMSLVDYWVTGVPCPSCGSNYKAWWPHGMNSNSFTFNMLTAVGVRPANPDYIMPGYGPRPGQWLW